MLLLTFKNWDDVRSSTHAIVKKFYYDWCKYPKGGLDGFVEFISRFNAMQPGLTVTLDSPSSYGHEHKWISFKLTEEQLLLSELQYADQPFFQLK